MEFMSYGHNNMSEHCATGNRFLTYKLIKKEQNCKLTNFIRRHEVKFKVQWTCVIQKFSGHAASKMKFLTFNLPISPDLAYV